MLPEPDPVDRSERLRSRREQARKRRRRHHTVALAVLIVAAALVALGATVIGTRGNDRGPAADAVSPKKKAKPAGPRAMPAEVRGVHVTMALASLRGKLEHYLAIPGLNTIELDVKDENGEVGFLLPSRSLARKVGAAKGYYDASFVAAKAHEAGAYLIGRVVVFEDPMLTAGRPDLAIQTSGG